VTKGISFILIITHKNESNQRSYNKHEGQVLKRGESKMTFALSLTLAFIFILMLFIIWETIRHRRKISNMAGMMVSMSLGMIGGLTVGVILGILLLGDLFSSTILAMLIGVLAGFLAGLPIGLMPVIDGMLAGIMGGMMGAMLGEMIAAEYQETIIRVMFLLFVGIIVILYQMMQQEFIKSKAIFNHPVTMIVLFFLFTVGYNQVGPLIIPSHLSNNGNHHDSMGVNSMVIQADEYSFTPSHTEIKAGEMVTITLDNIGEVEHDIEIIGMGAEIKEQSLSHDHGQDNNQLHLHSFPGERQEITFTALTTGTYRYVCTIPGHEELGMTGVIEIVS